MRPMAANAALRPFQMTARSSSDCATRISQAPQEVEISRTCAIKASTSAAGPSSSTSSGRQHARSDDPADGGARLVRRMECGEQRLNDLGALHNAKDDLGRNAQGTL